MVVSPAGFGIKNDCAGESSSNFPDSQNSVTAVKQKQRLHRKTYPYLRQRGGPTSEHVHIYERKIIFVIDLDKT
jgi:hypothetical protein